MKSIKVKLKNNQTNRCKDMNIRIISVFDETIYMNNLDNIENERKVVSEFTRKYYV